MWEGKVFADADAAETDWKHKVTPERGDLMNHFCWGMNAALIIVGRDHCNPNVRHLDYNDLFQL